MTTSSTNRDKEVKNFKKKYSRQENWNIITRTPIESGLNPNQQTFNRMDTFLRLGDTFVYSKKMYGGKRGGKIVVDEREQTLEVERLNSSKISFTPDYQFDGDPTMVGPYIKFVEENNPFAVEIMQDGNYTIIHKEELMLKSTTTKVYCYVEYKAIDEEGNLPDEGIPIAVFDREGNFSKFFPASFSLSSPEGSVSGTINTNVSFTLGQIVQKMTSFGFNERDCKKGDQLILHCVDQDDNDLELQEFSNFWSIQYKSQILIPKQTQNGN